MRLSNRNFWTLALTMNISLMLHLSNYVVVNVFIKSHHHRWGPFRDKWIRQQAKLSNFVQYQSTCDLGIPKKPLLDNGKHYRSTTAKFFWLEWDALDANNIWSVLCAPQLMYILLECITHSTQWICDSHLNEFIFHRIISITKSYKRIKNVENILYILCLI